MASSTVSNRYTNKTSFTVSGSGFKSIDHPSTVSGQGVTSEVSGLKSADHPSTGGVKFSRKPMPVSPAVALNNTELTVFHMVSHILHGHARLDLNDIQTAANYISSFYIYSQQYDPGLLPLDQLIMFLVYADQSSICKFALLFNTELDRAITTRDEPRLKSIITGPREMFVELYDNPFLLTADREFMIRLVSREIFAMNLTFELVKHKLTKLEPIETFCHSQTTISSRSPNHMTSLTTRCYDEVCLQDAQILEEDSIRGTMYRYERVPSTIYTVDKPGSAHTPQVFCFTTLDLIAAMTDDVPINPQTQQPFSTYAVEIIYQRFRKEIAMYRRYRQLASATP